jgi:hypothetical protein
MVLKLPAKEKKTAEASVNYTTQGKTIAAATFAQLSQRLQKSMHRGGVAEALSYCNVAAIPLVDSLSQVHQAMIKRTSLKVRNPQDAPTATEKVILEDYAKAHQSGQQLAPIVKELPSGDMAFYAPIQVNDFCLKCHGKVGQTLITEDYTIIKKLYPQDKATGYVAGDLRGMWSITLKK